MGVFSVFVLGYTIFQMLGGIRADRFGPRILGWATLSCALFTLLTGFVGKMSTMMGVSVLNPLIMLCFIFGICQAPMFPASGSGLARAGIGIATFLMPL
jgi:MFS family permease